MQRVALKKHQCLLIFLHETFMFIDLHRCFSSSSRDQSLVRQAERANVAKTLFFLFLCGIFGAVIPQSEHIATQFALKKEERDRAHAMGSCFG